MQFPGVLSEAKVGTEQIQDYSNTDNFYVLKLFDYGNCIIFLIWDISKKIGHNWKHACVFSAWKNFFLGLLFREFPSQRLGTLFHVVFKIDIYGIFI